MKFDAIDRSTDESDNPLVSVVIPTYNRSDLLRKAIQSVLDQTYQQFEVIVVDDGSTEEIASVVDSFNDPRVRCLRHETNKRLPAARNTGIRASSGKYIAFLDSDDEWLPQKLANQVALFESLHPQVGLLYGDAEYQYSNGVTRRYGFDGRRPMRGRVFNTIINHYIIRVSTVMLRREVLDHVGLFDETIVSGEDLHLFGIIAYDYEVWGMDDVLAIIRIHGDNMFKGQRSPGPHQLTAAYKVCNQLGISPRTMGRTMARCHQDAGLYYLENGDAREARRHLLRAFVLRPRQLRAAFLYFLSTFGGRPHNAYRAMRAWISDIRRLRSPISERG